MAAVAALILLEGACSRSASFYVDKGDKLYAKGAVRRCRTEL